MCFLSLHRRPRGFSLHPSGDRQLGQTIFWWLVREAPIVAHEVLYSPASRSLSATLIAKIERPNYALDRKGEYITSKWWCAWLVGPLQLRTHGSARTFSIQQFERRVRDFATGTHNRRMGEVSACLQTGPGLQSAVLKAGELEHRFDSRSYATYWLFAELHPWRSWQRRSSDLHTGNYALGVFLQQKTQLAQGEQVVARLKSNTQDDPWTDFGKDTHVHKRA